MINYISLLRSKGLRATNLRLAVIRHLDQNHGPFTAQEIFEQLGSTGNLATIYRIVESFVDNGLALKCNFEDGFSRYEIFHTKKEHHHHVICTKCQNWENIAFCPVDLSYEKIEKMGFTEISHRLEFFGICSTCR